jgi:hypothetical protein
MLLPYRGLSAPSISALLPPKVVYRKLPFQRLRVRDNPFSFYWVVFFEYISLLPKYICSVNLIIEGLRH